MVQKLRKSKETSKWVRNGNSSDPNDGVITGIRRKKYIIRYILANMSHINRAGHRG